MRHPSSGASSQGLLGAATPLASWVTDFVDSLQGAGLQVQNLAAGRGAVSRKPGDSNHGKVNCKQKPCHLLRVSQIESKL